MAQLSDLPPAVAALQGSVDQAVTLLGTLHAQGADPAQVQVVLDGINAAKAALDAGIAANPPLGS